MPPTEKTNTPSRSPKTSQKTEVLRAERSTQARSLVKGTKKVSRLITPDDDYIPQPQELKHWQMAVAIAGSKYSPQRTQLMNLYENMLNDTHLYSVVESRILKVARSKFRMVNEKTGKENPELTTMLKKPWFDAYLRHAMTSVFLGTTVIEIFEIDQQGRIQTVTLIPRTHIKPTLGLIVKDVVDETGWNYKDPPLNAFYIQVGEDKDLGLLSRVGPVVIAKKFAMGAWSHYTEKFGIPFRWITTDSTDDVRIKALNNILKMMAGAGYAVFGQGEKLEIMTANQQGKQSIFDDFIRRLNSEISKAVVGQDGTSDNKDAKGTYGSLKVLQDVADDRHESDRMMIRNNVNFELLPRLITYFGYPFAGHQFDWDNTIEMEPEKYIDAVVKLSDLYELDAKQISEKTGISILGPKIKADPEPDPNKDYVPPDPNPKPDPKTTSIPQKKKPDPATTVIHLPDFTYPDADPADLDDTTLRGIEEQLLRDVFENKAVFSADYYHALSQRYLEKLREGWNQITLQYSDMDHTLLTMMEASLYRFSGAKDVAICQQLNELLREQLSFEKFKESAKGLLNTYDASYLRTEYETAIASGMNAARYRQQVGMMDVLKFWKYQTAGDNRVRPAHQILDGKILPADDPTWSSIYPPNSWNCRCEVIAIDKPEKWDKVSDGDQVIDLLKTTGVDENGNSEWDRMVKSGFNVNRGNVATVFTENQMYLKSFDAKFGIKDMYGNADMKWDNLVKGTFPKRNNTLHDNEAALAWFEQKATDPKYVILNNNNGRPVRFTLDTFKKHVNITDKYKDRFKLVEFIPEVLTRPDEVWINGMGGETGWAHLFIKFYQDDMMVVIVESYAKTPMRIKTFMDVKSDKYRAGLLVKKYTG